MAQDIRELFQKEQKNETQANLPAGHEARFLKKLDAEFSKTPKTTWSWWYIAASIVVVLGVGFGTFKYFQVPGNIQVVDTPTDTEFNKGEIPTRTLGDISPDLKKVEDYYLANINFELSKVTLTPENKDLIDGYLTQLETLNQEYKRISLELTHSGPNELTVNALITNLKFRLNLMYRLKEQLETLKTTDSIRKRTNV
ncbi:hypothetical protein D778_02559 [Xanthomarina gelatinilytica]|uniref:Anti-sigma factor n=1 Tax=Xanthomarina gelatinilytica TaxID=1137281 RepID=M7MKQ0_9FLAO|nr:hypothetical protein [Xanthomarina gelatinilytica]EMQ95465.1 hypothetical protein D778_02559 [Xanthomarina gelatinilytica]